MAVFGIDLGDLNAVVSVARRGGIDVIGNEISKRETEAFVSFNPSDPERLIGPAGSDQKLRNWKNTVTHLKRLLCLRYDSPEREREEQHCLFRLVPADDGQTLVVVNFNGEEEKFRPEQLLAMLLSKLQSYASLEEAVVVKDCVISCPPYFTPFQRQAVLDAAQIAGLNCLTLINEQTSACLDWGIYKTSTLPETEEEAIFIAVVDIGNSATVITGCKFWKQNLKVLGHVWDEQLGCRDLDFAVSAHFRQLIKEKYGGMDVYEDKRARLRLLDACGRLRKTLSANPIGNLAVESIKDDRDIFFPKFTRDEYEAQMVPLIGRMESLVKRATQIPGMPEKLQAVELIGGGCRVPRLRGIVEEAFGVTLSTTLNASESVAKGCAIVGAMVSPKFKVREFHINDANSFAMEVRVTGNDDIPAEKALTYFPRGMGFPTVMSLRNSTSKPFQLSVLSGDKPLGRWSISGLPAGRDAAGEIVPGKPVQVTTRIRVDSSGIPVVEQTYVQQEWEVPEYEERLVQRPRKRARLNDEPPTAGGAATQAEAAKAQATEEEAAGEEAAEKAVPREETAEEQDAPEAKEAGEKKEAPQEEEAAQEKEAGEKAPENEADESAKTNGDAAGDKPAKTNGDAAGDELQGRKDRTEDTEYEVVRETVHVGNRIERRRVDVGVVPEVQFGIVPGDIAKFRMVETQMLAADKLLAETRETKNALESHIYDFRPRLEEEGDLRPYMQETSREAFLKQCKTLGDWLYEDGENETKDVYLQKFNMLRGLTDPALHRLRVYGDVEHAISQALTRAAKVSTDAAAWLSGESHIPKEKLEEVSAKAMETEGKCKKTQDQMNENPRTGEPLVESQAVLQWAQSLEDFARKIFSTPKPLKRKSTASAKKAKAARTEEQSAPPATPESPTPEAEGAGEDGKDTGPNGTGAPAEGEGAAEAAATPAAAAPADPDGVDEAD